MIPRIRTVPPKVSRAYRQLWRVVDGAVADAFAQHPDYLSAKGARAARASVVKRVVGAVLGFAEQSAEGRSAVAAPDNEPCGATPHRSRRGSQLRLPSVLIDAPGAICGVQP